jgi:PAS domain S-box-containing protein
MGEAPHADQNEGERTFRELADNAPVMIWRAGPDGLCNWFNKPWLNFVGRAMEHELGQGWSQGVHPDDIERCLGVYLDAFQARQTFTMTYRLRRADGAYRMVLDNGAPFYRDGEFAGYFGSCVDITEQQAVESQLRQAVKVEAIGQLTGGIAHDFNNLLQVIRGNLELLSDALPDEGRARNRFRNAMEAVARGSSLASQLLAFARRQPLQPKVINLGELIRETDDMLRRVLGGAVEVTTMIPRGLWNALVDPVLLETALLNLAVNARDAMDGRGDLTIEAGNAELADGAVLDFDVRAGQYVMVAVADTGCGMSAETIERAFDPFFTTKAEGRGTGLGLSTVQGFIKQSGGHVAIESRLGRGTTVRIYLPRSLELEDSVTLSGPSLAVGGAETILLVEDDDSVRSTTADMLTELGYTVLEARDADNAWSIIEQGALIDVLFTDVLMPGTLLSTELARRAKQRSPGIGVLFTSGTDIAVETGSCEERSPILSKPFTREELDRSLRSILAEREVPSPGLG